MKSPLTVGPASLRTRAKDESLAPSPSLPPSQAASLGYLAAVLHGEVKDEDDLSALDTNLIVVQILDAAGKSAETGHGHSPSASPLTSGEPPNASLALSCPLFTGN